MLEFRVLGPLEVSRDGAAVPLGGPKQRATLAILLLSANRVVSIERLADDLYAGAAPVTAVTQVQRQISELRKALGDSRAIETRAPGYALRVAPQQLDLHAFERRVEEGRSALERGIPALAAVTLREALALWRGAPLADLADELFAKPVIQRLEELRLAALELRLEADLALGRHAELAAELEALVAAHPLRERLRAHLMIALYRAGRQAEALDVYRRTRESLVREFGIEPSPALRELERRILVQDAALDARPPASVPAAGDAERALLLTAADEERLDVLLSVARPLAALPGRSLIAARLLADERDVPAAAAALNQRRFGQSMRTATFTSPEPALDVVRLATNYDAELILLDGPEPPDLAEIVLRSPADVAVCAGPPVDWSEGAGVFVPFGGGENDWAALELAAWLASAARVPLRLVGTAGDASRGRRDASRLLADASLAVQRIVGVAAEPLLAAPRGDALRDAVEPATVVVGGFPSRWPLEGLGDPRLGLVRAARPVLLVHRGTRPSGLAPREARTRFSWSLQPA